MNSTVTATTTSGEYHLNESIEIFYEVSKWLNVVMITLVAIFGIYGNIVSIIIFANPSYNKNSINSLRVYLILLATSDLLVLIFHYLDFTFRSWVNLTGMHSARFNFVDKSVFACKLVPYLRNVFRTVSVFTLVLMTLQRFILIYFPNVQAKLGSSTFSRSVAIILILLSALFNIVTAFVNDLDQHPITGETYCSISPVYVHLQFRFDLVFVLFTILLPAVLVVCLGFILYRKIRIRYKQLKMCKATSGEPIDEDEVSEHLKQQVVEQFEEERLQKSKRLSDYLNYVNTKFPQMPNMENLRTVDVKGMQKSASTMLINGNEKARMSNKPRQDSMNLGRQSIAISLPGSNQTSLRRNLKQSIKTTYMLLIVSKWFILLHFPYFICWCFYYVHMNKLHGRFSSDPNDIILISEWDLNKKILLKSLLQFFEILFLFNYSINFLLYFIYGPLFRKTHSKVIFKLVQNVFYYASYCFYHCAK